MSPRNLVADIKSPAQDGPPPTAWEELPATILERLARENVHSAHEWRALSRARRAAIFGITPPMRRMIDAAAKATCEPSAV